MTTSLRTFPATLIALAALASLGACSSVPDANAQLEQARSAYRLVQDDPQARTLAPVQLKQAGDALDQANAAHARRDDRATVDQLAYLATQRVAIARQTTQQKSAELTVSQADALRDKQRLAARTHEADTAQRQADASQRSADASQQQAAASQRQADASNAQAQAAQQQSSASQQQAADAQARTRQLEAQLKELDAKPTDRGLVVTIGDVLFDTDQAQLKSGAARNVDKLVAFLKAYPQRTARIEGYTDDTGSDSHNQALSTRRAQAVRMAMVGAGVGGDRIAAQGYGEAFPVAGNDNAAGRQMNRRVEVVLSDDNGMIRGR